MKLWNYFFAVHSCSNGFSVRKNVIKEPVIRKNYCAALCLILTCAGCVYDYTLPPDYYKGSPAVFSAGDIPVEAGSAPVPDTIGIEDCIRLVVRNNPDILSAVSDSTMAEESVNIAMSYLIPKITLEANQTYSRFDMTEYTDPYTSAAPDELMTARISTRYLLYDFGQARSLVSKRYADTDSARAQVRTVADRLVMTAVALFYSVKAMEEDIRVFEKSIESLTLRLGDAEKFKKQGLSTQSSVLTVSAALENLKYRKSVLENTSADTLVTLRRMMGIPLDSSMSLADADKRQVPHTELSLHRCIDAALSLRPEIKAAQASAISAQHGIDAAQASRWPLFLVSADVSYTDLDWMEHDGYTVRGNVSMQWNMYDGNETAARIRIEREKLRKAQLRLRAARDMVTEEVMAALSDIRELKLQEKALKAAVRSAEQNVREIKSLFSNRKATASEVVDAEKQVIESRSNMNKVKYSFSKALYALEKSTGTSLENLLPPGPVPCSETGSGQADAVKKE